jgi:hypothetical protein
MYGFGHTPPDLDDDVAFPQRFRHQGFCSSSSLRRWSGGSLNRIEVAVLASDESGSLHWTVNALLIRATIKLAAGIEQGAQGAADDLLSAADVVTKSDDPSSVAALAAVAGRVLSGGDPEAAAALLGRSGALGRDHPLHGVM